jgi:hypothetical protein
MDDIKETVQQKDMNYALNIIKVIKDKYLSLSKPERNKLWKDLNSMLVCVAEYKKLLFNYMN